MSAARSYIPPAEIGEVMRAGGRLCDRVSSSGFGRSYLDTKDLIVFRN
jgi:hypothetical protein